MEVLMKRILLSLLVFIAANITNAADSKKSMNFSSKEEIPSVLPERLSNPTTPEMAFENDFSMAKKRIYTEEDTLKGRKSVSVLKSAAKDLDNQDTWEMRISLNLPIKNIEIPVIPVIMELQLPSRKFYKTGHLRTAHMYPYVAPKFFFDRNIAQNLEPSVRKNADKIDEIIASVAKTFVTENGDGKPGKSLLSGLQEIGDRIVDELYNFKGHRERLHEFDRILGEKITHTLRDIEDSVNLKLKEITMLQSKSVDICVTLKTKKTTINELAAFDIKLRLTEENGTLKKSHVDIDRDFINKVSGSDQELKDKISKLIDTWKEPQIDISLRKDLIAFKIEFVQTITDHKNGSKKN
jgi:hypothetical protein